MAVSDPYRMLQVRPDADHVVLKAAFRALALKYHPDKDPSPHAARLMIDLNEAYALVRSVEVREAFDRRQRRAIYGFEAQPASVDRRAVPPPPPRAPSAGTQLPSGRYTGWTLRDLARHDPDYLRWLSRHASGLRYRTEIYQILGRMASSAA